jgi:sulfatase modifying factor 1
MRYFCLRHGRWIRSRVLCVTAGAFATIASMVTSSYAGTIIFGSDANTFSMEFVTIGNPDNAADTDINALPLNAGAVGYTYDMGKFEVSRDMITKYNANFGTNNNLVITLNDMTSFGGNGSNRPATGITWNEAARFVNWLNISTGNKEAYKFAVGSDIDSNIQLWTSGDAGYDASNKYRNSLARYFLPSYNEWYKAAYYNPNDGTYYDYANGSNTRPTAVTGGLSGAVYTQTGEASPVGPADVTNAGGLSPYQVMGLNGNAREWEESSTDLANNNGASNRGIRGGSWLNNSSALMPSSRGNNTPSLVGNNMGFRVASLSSSAPPAVPEPSMMVIVTLFSFGGLAAKRRMKK